MEGGADEPMVDEVDDVDGDGRGSLGVNFGSYDGCSDIDGISGCVDCGGIWWY